MLVPKPAESETSNPQSPNVLKRLLQNPLLLAIALLSSTGGFLFGCKIEIDEGVISSIQEMEAFKMKFPMSSSEKGIVVSILELGGWLGTYFIGAIADKISRKYSIMVALFFFLLGSILQTSSQRVLHLILGRFISGFGIGSLSLLGPLYQSEVAPPDIRGSIVSIYKLSVTIGVAASFWVGYGTSHVPGDMAWRLPLLVQVAAGTLMLIGVFFLPFSPRWLMQAGREEEAHRVLVRLRRATDVDQEWKEIRTMTLFEQHIEEQQLAEMDQGNPDQKVSALRHWCHKECIRYANVLRHGMWKRVLIGSLVMFFQQWLGLNSIIYYAPLIIHNLGITDTSVKLFATGIIGVVMVISCFMTVFVIDLFGRRLILMLGTVAVFICMVIIGTLCTIFAQSWPEHLPEGWLCIALIYVYCSLYAFSWGPVAWLIPSEIFPIRVRAKAMAITSSSHWMNLFIVGFITPQLIEKSPSAIYFMFAGMAILAFIFVFFFIPETKNKTLEEIDLIYGGNTAMQDKELMADIREQVDQLGIASTNVKV
ncbi:arabinose-proton symporter [Hesseltinella vesiculosa]|uniref:Arabinose-proton symporter n=1 Tax=Hesseltinella vesiculosa TaxID=101127 RepID=A0A1X2GGG9_9FUNG|nr:arabinose-proton symporter [Hesseltinella vesiculosa]